MNRCDDHCDSIPAVSLHSRRGIITALASVAVLSPGLSAAATDASADDERFMRSALDEARQADSPFGAVIVRDGQLLARGRNLRRTNGDPTAHGEMTAIRRCLVDHGSAALRGSTLYTPVNPAPCAWVRFYGAASAAWSLPSLCSSSLPHAIRS